MKIIDAHHHTWDRTIFPYTWMDDPHPVGDISDLKKNYLIEDLLEDAKDLELIKSVHIQCGGGKDSPVEETKWLQFLADRENAKGFPHGIVAYSDFLDPNAEQEIEMHCEYKNTRGIRYLLNFDPEIKLIVLRIRKFLQIQLSNLIMHCLRNTIFHLICIFGGLKMFMQTT